MFRSSSTRAIVCFIVGSLPGNPMSCSTHCPGPDWETSMALSRARRGTNYGSRRCAPGACLASGGACRDPGNPDGRAAFRLPGDPRLRAGPLDPAAAFRAVRPHPPPPGASRAARCWLRARLEGQPQTAPRLTLTGAAEPSRDDGAEGALARPASLCRFLCRFRRFRALADRDRGALSGLAASRGRPVCGRPRCCRSRRRSRRLPRPRPRSWPMECRPIRAPWRRSPRGREAAGELADGRA